MCCFHTIAKRLLGHVYVQNPNDPTILSDWRRVAFVEDFFDILNKVHCKEKGHIGEKKTVIEVRILSMIVSLTEQHFCTRCCHSCCLLQVSKMYECLPRAACEKFVELCLVCHSQKPQTTRAPLKPIISSGFMTRGQVQCIASVCVDTISTISESISAWNYFWEAPGHNVWTLAILFCHLSFWSPIHIIKIR